MDTMLECVLVAWVLVYSLCCRSCNSYPHGWDQELQNLHSHMTPEEAAYYFGKEGQQVPQYEIVFLSKQSADTPDYNFRAFGKQVRLQLRRNSHLVSRHFRTLVHEIGSLALEMVDRPPSCHFLHSDSLSSAAISMCYPQHMQGLVFLTNETFEIRPLTVHLHAIVEHQIIASGLKMDDDGSIPHLIKRVPPFQHLWADELRLLQADSWDTFKREVGKGGHTNINTRPVLEAALFFDEAGYRLFTQYFQHNDQQLRDMLLAYVNGVQALYHHPSIGQPLDISLVRLELFKTQPSDLPHHNGERNQLLDSFCAYSAKHNPEGDKDPQHWDMGLYVSGLDLYAVENGQRSSVTLGLAGVGGVCMDKYACVIVELGTTNELGKPYPSAGFTSVYILAHEMGHNLGMHHDGFSNSCPRDGYIMSPSRGMVGETTWSQCSAEVMSKLSSRAKCLYDSPSVVSQQRNHAMMGDFPGASWGAKRQCEILLKDKDAEVELAANMQNICQNLQCRTPHRSGFYFAGPALEGTTCEPGKWCHGGECVVMETKLPGKVVKGGWGNWASKECSSGCIVKSRGFQAQHRECNSPKPVNTEEGCDGSGFNIVLCKDEKICKKMKRITASHYATMKCKEFSKLVPGLDPKGYGRQALHEDGRIWMGCAIFCRRKHSGSYYTPRLDLNDLGIDPYFPDGTWCHHDAKLNYYCLQHHCVPETAKLGKSLHLVSSGDVPISQNALPHQSPLPEVMWRYLGLDQLGRPLLTAFGTPTMPPQHDWDTRDYVEIPQAM